MTGPTSCPPIHWVLARPFTILQAIRRTERYLLRDLDAAGRRDEEARLDQLRALLKHSR